MLADLRAQHREIARLKFEGFDTTQIATTMGMTPSRVSVILGDPLCQAAIARLQDKADESVIDVRKQLVKLNKPALEVIRSLLEDDIGVPHNVQLAAAKDVLDRTGYAAPKETRNYHAILTVEDLEVIKRRAMQGGHCAEDSPDDEDTMTVDPLMLDELPEPA